MNPTPRSTHLAALAAALTVALARWTPLFDPDAFWHLHTGRFITERGAIPWRDSFSHTAAGRPWRFIDVVADVILYAAWKPAGALSLTLFTLALGALAAALSTHTQARRCDDAHPTAPALLAVLPWLATALAFRLTPRPQTFTFVALAALLYALDRARRDARWWWSAPVIAGVWQALHPSGPLAVAVTGAYAVGATIEHLRTQSAADWKRAWIATVLSVPALLACPHPLDRVREGLTHVADAQLAALITEWQPVWKLSTVTPPVAALIALSLLALGGALAPPAKRPPWGPVLAAVGVSVLGLRAVRFLPLAAIALAPLAALGAQSLLRRAQRFGPRVPALLAALVALGGLFELHAERKPFGVGVNRTVMPVGAADFIARTNPPGRLVHDFEMGGYLMWRLGDAHPVFVDGRSWALYPTDLLLDALQLTGERLDRVVRDRDLGLAVLWTEARVGRLQAQGWQLVYLDDTASVLVREAPDAPFSARYGYRELRPSRWFEDVDRWASNETARTRALTESDRVVREAPTSAFAWVLRGAALTASHDERGADEATARALTLRPDLTAPHRLAMLRCDRRNDAACACRESLEVRARSPQNASAMAVVARYGCR